MVEKNLGTALRDRSQSSGELAKTEWTPGPWSVGKLLSNVGQRAVLGQHTRVALADLTVNNGEREANAALIAAAPDLYAALSDLLENPNFEVAVGGNPIAVDAMLVYARAALLKARGA